MAEVCNEERIAELEAKIQELEGALGAQNESEEKKHLVDFAKVKGAIDSSAEYVLNAIRPVMERYEEPSKAAVAKVGGKVSENPFLSVAVAFGAGIVIGTVLNYCCKAGSHSEE